MTHRLSELRVLIVDDDPVFRWIISMSLRRLGVVTVEIAEDLSAARTLIEQRSFDLITIDVVLRGESGMDLLSWIHAHYKTLATILLTSDSTGEAAKVVDALLLGASTLIIKPSGADAPRQLDRALRPVLQEIARNKQGMTIKAVPSCADSKRMIAAHRELLAIGASTGGPPVLLELLSALPRDHVTPILITQHMPSLHMTYFAQLLQGHTWRKVKLADHSELISPGHVYIAPGNVHLCVTRTSQGIKLLHLDGPEEHNCKPAVDPMFRSVAVVCGARAIGVVMTGMGSDGAAGAAMMHEAGAPILVQDRESSVVWGMPGATVGKDVADFVGRPAEIANKIVSLDSRYQRVARKVI